MLYYHLIPQQVFGLPYINDTYSFKEFCISNVLYTFLLLQGLDMGGLQKEFFQLISEAVFDPSYGMFVTSEENRTIWINGMHHHLTKPVNAKDTFILRGGG